MLRLLLPLLVTPTLVWAAETAPKAPGTIGPFLKMLASLGLVVGLLLLFYAAYKRGFGMLPGIKEGKIKVLESRPLGGRKFLCRVQVKDQELLLGVTNDRINLLTELTSEPENRFEQELSDAESSS